MGKRLEKIASESVIGEKKSKRKKIAKSKNCRNREINSRKTQIKAIDSGQQENGSISICFVYGIFRIE